MRTDNKYRLYLSIMPTGAAWRILIPSLVFLLHLPSHPHHSHHIGLDHIFSKVFPLVFLLFLFPLQPILLNQIKIFSPKPLNISFLCYQNWRTKPINNLSRKELCRGFSGHCHKAPGTVSPSFCDLVPPSASLPSLRLPDPTTQNFRILHIRPSLLPLPRLLLLLRLLSDHCLCVHVPCFVAILFSSPVLPWKAKIIVPFGAPKGDKVIRWKIQSCSL